MSLVSTGTSVQGECIVEAAPCHLAIATMGLYNLSAGSLHEVTYGEAHSDMIGHAISVDVSVEARRW